MRLQEAFTMMVEYLGESHPIKVNQDGMICLNDMALYFPKKTLKNWLRTNETKEFIMVIERFLNSSNVRDLKGADLPQLKIDDFGSRGGIPKGLKSISTRRGKYEGGTYAYHTLALEFATWLSPEFKLNVLLAYENGTQNKKDWNIKRILASFNYKIMSKAIRNDHEEPKHYHYSNEARMLNRIVFGKPDKELRDSATEQELDLIAKLEGHNTTMIELGMDYQERKEKLPLLIKKDLKLTGKSPILGLEEK
ncbi:MAG: KilA-N domain-containing protein [Alteromonadales bacterium]|nr:KilA-N domain-containing protein [Alteromonadales bacterium]